MFHAVFRMDALRIEIPGAGLPQPRVRCTRAGKIYTPDKAIKPYKQVIGLRMAMEAKRCRWPADTDGDGYAIDLEVILARPASHLTASGELRKTAPVWPGLRCGDVDNLGKAVMDAVTACGAVWRDDAQVVDMRSRKRYAARGEAERVVIAIRRVPP